MCLRLRFSREAGTALLDLLVGISLVLMVTMMNDHVSSWHISLSLSHAQVLLADLGWQKLVARFLTQNLTGGCAGTVPLN